MTRIWITVALAGTLVGSAAGQQPNLSGKWRLNVSKSFMGSDHPANDYQLTKVIEDSGRLIKQTDIAVHVAIMNIDVPDSTAVSELIADGQEHDGVGTSPLPGLIPAPRIKAVVEWQGETLFIKEFGMGYGGASTTIRRYFLSDKAEQLIELIDSRSALVDLEQRLVFEKQH